MKNLLIFSIMIVSLIACSPSANRQKSYQNNYDAERCKELSDRVEELKGKPIRRNAAHELYLAECVNRT